MADLSRRGFLTQVSVTTGIGLAGGLGLHKLLLSDASAAAEPTSSPAPRQAQGPTMDNVTLAGPMVVHIRDLATSEVSMMVGAQELIYRDPELVSRLVNTARAGRVEG